MHIKIEENRVFRELLLTNNKNDDNNVQVQLQQQQEQQQVITWSTDVAASLLCDNVRKEIDQGNLVGAVFIDLSKAFDTIGHSILLSKLPCYGIDESELQWFTDYIFRRHQTVCYLNEFSEPYPVTCGVPHGSILGPLLFLMVFNDMYLCLNKARLITFADDTVIYFSHNDFHVIENTLNNELNSISEYLRDNELIINLKTGKTESMLFGTSKKLKVVGGKLSLKFGHLDISPTKRYTYLGTLIDPRILVLSLIHL